MYPDKKNRKQNTPLPTSNEWISLSEAAQGVPYSAEYLSLLARRKLLPAKKIRGVWYTTSVIVKEYMRRQMARSLRDSSFSAALPVPVGNSRKDWPCGARPVLASEFSTGISSEEAEKINENIFVENIISHVGEEAASTPPRDLSHEPAFSVIPSSLSFHPHLKKTQTISDDALGFAENLVSVVSEEASKKKTWAEEPFSLEGAKQESTLKNDGILKIISDEKTIPSPEDAYAGILFQKFITSFTAFLDKEIEQRESFLSRAWHTVRAAYSAVLSHKKLFSLFLIFLLVFTVLPFRVVSAFFDNAYRTVAAAVNDANTVLGFRPGTHENEILLLDQEGKIAIFGNVETEGQFKSFVEDGIAPIYVKSTTKAENLNADYLDDLSSEEFTLAFVTKNGNVTYDDVFLEGKVAVGQTLLVRGAANLLSSLSVDGELSVFGDTKLYKNLTVDGSSYFKALLSAQDIAARHIYADRVNATELVADGVLSVHGNANVDGQIVVQGFGLFQGGVSGDTGTFRRGVSTGGNLSARGDVNLGGSGSEVSIASDNLWSITTEGVASFKDTTIGGNLSVSATTSVGRLQAGNLGIGTTTPGYEIGVVGSGLFEGLVIAYEGFVGNTLTATSTLSAEGLASFLSGFISSASSTISATLHVLDALTASSTLVVDGLSTLYGGLLSTASSTIGGPLYVQDNLSASSTFTLGGLGIFESGFISNASSSATILSASDSLYASSSIAVDGMSLFALTGGNVGIGTTSPGTLLAVQGDAFINDALTVGGAFSATSTLSVGDLSTLAGFISTASSTIGGPFYVQDHLSASSTLTLGELATFEGGAILGGASSTVSGTLSFSNNVIANKGSIDIGDAGTRFGIIYADEVNATTLVGVLTGGNTSAETFTINSDNTGADDDSFLAFERGDETPNALLQWDSANDNFVFNFGIVASASSSIAGPLYVSDNLSASSTLTVASLATFDGGFISSASSTVSAPFHVSDVITSSSSIAVDGNSFFAVNSGKVHIGTTLASARKFNVNDGTDMNLGIVNDSGYSAAGGIALISTNDANSAYAPLTIFGNDVIINSGAATGNVGIRTANPQALLDVQGAASSTSLRIDGASSDAPLIFATNITGQDAVHSWTIGADQSDGGKFKIASSTALGTSDRFVIDGAGNVGIGTASPAATLDIVGGFLTTASSTVSALLTAESVQVNGILNASSSSFFSGDALFLGNVSIGLGTTTPTATSTQTHALTVRGGAQFDEDIEVMNGAFSVKPRTAAFTGVTFDNNASGNTAPFAITQYGGYFWVTDSTSGKVYKYNVDGTYTGVALDASGTGTNYRGITQHGGFLWLVDAGNREVWKYTTDGVYTGISFDTNASGNTSPNGITQYGGYFWITDQSGMLIYKYNLDGTYTGISFSIPETVTPRGITQYGGYFWITRFGFGVYKYTTDGVYTGVNFVTTGAGNASHGGLTQYDGYFWLTDTVDQIVYKYAIQNDTLVLGQRSASTTPSDGTDFVDSLSSFGVGTSSPWGLLSVHASSTNIAIDPIFVVGSTTPTGTNDTLFVINSLGNVGVGTSTMAFPVDIYKDSSDTSLSIIRANNPNAAGKSQILFNGNTEEISLGVFNSNFAVSELSNLGMVGASGNLRIAASTTVASGGLGYISFSPGGYANEKMRLTSDGNVGIGTTNPGVKLTVNGGRIGVYDSSQLGASGGVFEIGTDATTRNASTTNYIFTDAANGDLYIRTDSASQHVLLQNTSSGNVGIGTTSPSATLAVTNASGEYSFWVNDTTTDTTPFVIDGAGNVGVGTANPAATLDIVGGFLTTASSTVGNTLHVLDNLSASSSVSLDRIVSFGQNYGTDIPQTLATTTLYGLTNTGSSNANTAVTYYLDDLAIKAQGHTTGTWFPTNGNLASVLKGGDLLLYGGAAVDTGNNGSKEATYTGGDIAFYSGIAKNGSVESGTPNQTQINYGNILFYTPTGMDRTDETWTEFMRIDGGGFDSTIAATTTPKMGVGTTTPWGLLSVHAASLSAAIDPIFVVGSTTPDGSNNTLFVINSAGNVGVGKSNPAATLDIVGGFLTTASSTVSALLTAESVQVNGILNASSSSFFSGDALFLGNVSIGLGTTTPTATSTQTHALTVQGGASFGGDIEVANSFYVKPRTADYADFTFDTAIMVGDANSNFRGITRFNGYFWATDVDDQKVYQINLDGTYTGTSWSTNVGGSGNTSPREMTQYGGFLWIVNPVATEVYKYTFDGTYTGVHFDTAASGDVSPSGIVQYGGFFWIPDATSLTVYKYALDGSFTGVAFPLDSSITIPTGIEEYGGYFWIVDSGSDYVYKYTTDGTYTGIRFNIGTSGNTNPYDIVHYNGFFWITDIIDDVVYKYAIQTDSYVVGNPNATSTPFTSFGVGTTSPWGLLSVHASSTNTAVDPIFVVGSTTPTGTNNTLFVINNLGNVGVGTASPAATLDIVGGFLTTASSTVGNTLHVLNNLSASSTLTVASLATFDSGFISSASSTVAALLTAESLQVNGILNASSSSFFSGDALFLGNVSIGLGTTTPTATSTQTHALTVRGGAQFDEDIEVMNGALSVKPRTAAYTGVTFDVSAGGTDTFTSGITEYGGYFWIVAGNAGAGGREVYKYNLDGTYTGISFDTNVAGNTNPFGITQYGGYFWVVDTANDEVHKYTTDGTYTGFSFDTSASGNTNPFGITQYGEYFWVTDRTSLLVYKYDLDGTYTGIAFSTPGTGSGNTDPTNITQYGGYFWVADNANSEVYKYTTDFQYTGVHFDTAVSGAATTRGITQYGGYFWITDSTLLQVYKYAIQNDTLVLGQTSASTTPSGGTDFVDSLSSFGVGTSSPWGLLSVHASSTNIAIDPIFVVGSTTPTGESNTLFVINSLGNVGVGKSNPAATLDIVGGFLTTASSTVGGTLHVLDNLSASSSVSLDGSVSFGKNYGASIPTTLATTTLYGYSNSGNNAAGGTADTTYYLDDLAIKAQGHTSSNWRGNAVTSVLKGGDLSLYGGAANDYGNNGTAASTYTGGNVAFYSGVARNGTEGGAGTHSTQINYGNILFYTPTGMDRTDETWTEFMRIDGGGFDSTIAATTTPKMGVGTTTPWGLLSVHAASLSAAIDPIFVVGSTTPDGTNNTLFVINSAGNVGVGKSNPAATLDIVGGFLTTASSTVGSTLHVLNNLSASSTITQDGGNVLFAITSGNVGIGTTTPISKFTITQGSFWQSGGDGATNYTPTLVGSVPIGVTVSANDIFTVGNRVYVGTRTSGGSCSSTIPTGCEFRIYDVATATPQFIGGFDIGNANSIQGVFVVGDYAYLTIDSPSPSQEFLILDVSNPGQIATTSTTDLGASGIDSYVSGRYAYIERSGSSGNEFIVYDVSDPRNPLLIGGVELTPTDAGSVIVKNNFAYITRAELNPTQMTENFIIYDVSDPANIATTSAIQLGLTSTKNIKVAVQGNYAYVTKANEGVAEDFIIYDISNPYAAATTSGIDLGTDGNEVVIAGRYAYTGQGSGNEFSIYDISDPYSILLVGSADTTNAVNALSVKGNRAFLGLTTGGGLDEFRVYDISGAEVQSMLVHSLEAGNLYVRNDAIIDGRIASDSLNVGAMGLFSRGSITAFVASSTATTPISAAFMGGNVGVGTTTPWRTLSVTGTVGFSSSITTESGTDNYLCIHPTTYEVENGGANCGASSLRYKENIEKLTYGLTDVLKLKPVSFQWKETERPNDRGRYLGFIAEDMVEVIPEVVELKNGLPESVDYAKLSSVLAGAIQEIGIRIDLISAPTTTPSLAIDSEGFVSTAKNFIAGRTLYVRDDTGFVGIGTSTPDYPLQVAGDIAANSFINVSARDTKKDIEQTNFQFPISNFQTNPNDSIPNAKTFIEKIKDLPLFTYRYTYEAKDAPKRIGLIADASPDEVLSADKRGVDLYKLVTFTIGGVKELAYKVDALVESIAGLTEKTDIYDARLAVLEEKVVAMENSGVRSDLAPQGPTLLEFSTATSNIPDTQYSILDTMTAVIASLADFGMTIVDGVAHFAKLVVNELLVQKLVVENITARALTLGDSANRAGITMYDKNTGEPYCLSVADGNVVTMAGMCEATNPNDANYYANNTNVAVENSDASADLAPLLEFPTATTEETTVVDAPITETTESTSTTEQIVTIETADATTTEETAVENSDASADLAPLLEFPTATTTEIVLIEETATITQ